MWGQRSTSYTTADCNLINAQEKYDGGASKDVYKIVTGDEPCIWAYEPETKHQSTVWVFELEPNPMKVVCGKLWAVFLLHVVMWRLFHLSIVEWLILSGTPQLVCLQSSQKFEKRSRQDESLFNMAMRALTHRLKSASYWLAKTSNWWADSADLASNGFFLFPHFKKNRRGQRFSSITDTVGAFKNHVL